jgi:hypothetical protein
MPFYEAGEHKVDHPPLFACREHKQFLRLRGTFIDEMLASLSDMMPGNLHEIAAPLVNGDTTAFRLPDYLIPPRVLIYNPGGLRGAAALPFTLVFIDKRFIGIPAAYLTASCFEGCPECPAESSELSEFAETATARPPAPRPQPAPPAQRPAAPAKSSNPGSSTIRQAVAPPGPPAQKKPGTGPMPQIPRPQGPPPPAPARRPASESERRPVQPPPRPPQR